MKMHQFWSLAVGAIFLAAAISGYASTVYDLNTDWSDAANPNGPWTYRQGTTALPSQANWLPGQFSGVQPAWAVAASGLNHVSAWLKSSATPLFNVADLDFQIGDVLVHTQDGSGPGLGPANVIWTSPITGVADITGSVWLARNIGRGSAISAFS